MATFNKLNVNDNANLQQLVVGNHSDNFISEFLTANNSKFTVTSGKTDDKDLLSVTRGVAGSSGTVTLKSGNDVSNHYLEVQSSGVDISKLTMGEDGLTSSTKTTLGGQLDISDGTTTNFSLADSGGISAAINFGEYDVTDPDTGTIEKAPKLQIKDTQMQFRDMDLRVDTKLVVKQKDLTSTLLRAHASDNTLLVNANTTFRAADVTDPAGSTSRQVLMTLNGDTVEVPDGATFNSKQTTNLSGTTTLKNSTEDKDLLTADDSGVSIGNDVTFTSPTDTVLGGTTTITDDVYVGTLMPVEPGDPPKQKVAGKIVVQGPESVISAKAGAQIKFSSSDFVVDDGGGLVISGENFLSTISDRDVLEDEITKADGASPDYKNRLLRHSGMQLEQVSAGSNEYFVKHDPASVYYTSSASNSTAKVTVAQVRKRKSGTDKPHFVYNRRTYEEVNMGTETVSEWKDKKNAVLVKKADDGKVVDRLVENTTFKAVLQRTPKRVQIDLLGEKYTMKSKHRTSGHVMYTPILKLRSAAEIAASPVYGGMRVGWTMVLEEREGDLQLQSREATGLDVWYENNDKTKFIVHNYHDSEAWADDKEDKKRAACGWYLLQLFGTTVTDKIDADDPVHSLLQQDLANRVLITKLTTNNPDEDGWVSDNPVRHYPLSSGLVTAPLTLPLAGLHAVLNTSLDDSASPTTCVMNNVLGVSKKGTTEYWFRVRSKYDPVVTATRKVESGKATTSISSSFKEHHTDNLFQHWRVHGRNVDVVMLVYRTHNEYDNYWGKGTAWYRFGYTAAQMDKLTSQASLVKDVWAEHKPRVSDYDRFTTDLPLTDLEAYNLMTTDTPDFAGTYGGSGRIDLIKHLSNRTSTDPAVGPKFATFELYKGEHPPGPITDPLYAEVGVEDAKKVRHVSWASSVYTWTTAKDAPASYLSRQQSWCMLAPVVLHPMLRNETELVTKYKFLGGQYHPAEVGAEAQYQVRGTGDKLAEVYDVDGGPIALTVEKDVIIHDAEVKLVYPTEPVDIQPLFMIGTTEEEFRVSTIGNNQFNTVKANQYYYVSKDISGRADSWIFPNYGSEGGWYVYSGWGGAEGMYGTQSFWKSVAGDRDSLSLVLPSEPTTGPDGDNYSMTPMMSTVVAGPLKMYHFADIGSTHNKLFSERKGDGAVVSSTSVTLTKVNPLDHAKWFALNLQDGTSADIILDHDMPYDTRVYVASESNVVTGPDMSALNQGDEVKFEGAVLTDTYTFWALGGGAIDAQDVIVRGQLRVEATSTLNHVNCQTLTVESEHVALGTKKGADSAAVADGSAALHIITTYEGEAIESATTKLTGGMEVFPVRADHSTTADYFEVKDLGGEELQLKAKSNLNLTSSTNKTWIKDNWNKVLKKPSVDCQFGALKAKYNYERLGTALDPTVKQNYVTIGEKDSARVKYNLKDTTVQSQGMHHVWDEFMKYTTGEEPSFGIGGLTSSSVHVDKDGVTLGHDKALTVPNDKVETLSDGTKVTVVNPPIEIKRDTNVTGATLTVKNAGGSTSLSGDSNTFTSGVTTFGTTESGITINNSGTDHEGVPAGSAHVSLPLTTSDAVSMATTITDPTGSTETTTTNVDLTNTYLTLRNTTVTLEGGEGDRNIVIKKTPAAGEAKTSFYQNLAVIGDNDTGTDKVNFFDATVTDRTVSLSNEATLHVNDGCSFTCDGSVQLTKTSDVVARVGPKVGGGTGTEWLRLNTTNTAVDVDPSDDADKIDAQTLEIGNLTVSGDAGGGKVQILGGGKFNVKGETAIDLQSGLSGGHHNWLTVTTSNSLSAGGTDPDHTFQAGTLKSTSGSGVEIDGSGIGAAMHIPKASGDITITRNVDMKDKNLTVNNFEVMGTMTTKHAQEVQIGDSNMLLNAHHGLNTPQDAGIVVKCKRVSDDIVTATAMGTAGNLHGLGSSFETGDILSVMAVDPDGSGSLIPVDHEYNGLYVCSGGSDERINLMETPNLSFCKSKPSDLTETLERPFQVYKVMVHHLKFHMVADHDDTGAMSAGGTVSYGHGSTVDHFNDEYGYRDMMMGDIHSSVDTVNATETGDTVTVSKAITHIPKVPGGAVKHVILHSSPKNGATYKIVNSQTTQAVMVWGHKDNKADYDRDTTTAPLFLLNPDGHSSFSRIGTEWYEKL